MVPRSVLYSVIITTYNYAHYLKRAIDSVLAQEFERFEIIVVDDGSDDETRAIASQYGEEIRFVHQPHFGPFVAARTGFRLARGSHIIFVDADDRLRPGALHHLHATAIANPNAAIVLGRTCSIDEGRATVVTDPCVTLAPDPTENFARFCRGQLKAPIAGSLIETSLLRAFDREGLDYPCSMDLAIFGLGLAKGCVQVEQTTLDVFAHEARLRDDIHYIHRSGLQLVDVLFDDTILPPACMGYRREFIGFLERERTRSYYRAGWHSLAWRSYWRAVTAAPVSALHGRSLRRCCLSLARAALRQDEGPVASPPSHRLLGHQRAFYRAPIAFTANAVERLRTNIRLNLQRRTYLIVGPSDIEQILKRQPYSYQPAGIARIAPAFAAALLGAPHPRHEEIRRWVASFFSTKAVDQWAPVIGAILERRTAEMAPADTIDLTPIVRSAQFDIASRIILGCDSPELIARLDRLLSKSHNYSSRILRSFCRLPRWIPLRSHRVIHAIEKEIDAFYQALIDNGPNNVPPSVLEQMLADPSTNRSFADIRANTAGLLLATCEPVTVTTTIALHLLGKDEALQQRIVDEFSQAERGRQDRVDVRTFDLLRHFIDEVHRLYPAEFLLTRQAIDTNRLPSGLLVRSGHQVMINLNCLHRNASVFANPNRFDPDRFRNSALKASGSYLPFGAGITTCLGVSLARLIIAMSLHAILSKWHVKSLNNTIELDSPNCFSVTTRGPVMAQLQRR